MKFGVPYRFDRAAQTVRALIDPFFVDAQDPPTPVECGYRGALPPVPFLPAMFTDDLTVCLGSLVVPETIFHEDFTNVPTLDPGVIGSVEFDTSWRITGGPSGTFWNLQPAPGVGAGVAQLTAEGAGSATNISKLGNGVLLSSFDAYFLQARFALAGLLTGQNIANLSFSAASGTNSGWSCFFATTVGSNWNLRVLSDGGSETIDTGIPPVAGLMLKIEMFMVPERFSALYLNGAGPFVSANPTAQPRTNREHGPIVGIQRTSGAGNVMIQPDLVDVAGIASNGIVHPSLLGLVP